MDNSTGDVLSDESSTAPCYNVYCLSDEDYINMVEQHVQPNAGEWILVVIFIILFIVGLVGNFLVCYAVIKNSQMRTVTNLFIMNLAIADFMVILICLPSSLLVDVSETWFFGEVMCKIFLYLQTVSVAVSVLTLSAISIERWYAICHPLSFKSTASRARNIILTIWLLSACVASPDLVTARTYRSLPMRYNYVKWLVSCRPSWTQRSQFIYQMFLFIALYFLPFCLMAFTYTRITLVLWREDIPGVNETAGGHRLMAENRNPNTNAQLQTRRKAAKMLITVVIVFGICNLPVHILNIVRYANISNNLKAISIFSLISRLLCYVNSAINPIIYNFMSAKFRKEFKSVCLCCVSPLEQEQHTQRPKSGGSYNISYSRTNCQTEQFTLISVKE
ncbi:orexin receptor type 2 [Octopus bimaculoides]|nr:orexin receptor type 2 [Octopus bimaculoides]|eukprot:XP_014772633.1 PREDICTED: orexin receptor type 2-like [Octopus bimaculoides]